MWPCYGSQPTRTYDAGRGPRSEPNGCADRSPLTLEPPTFRRQSGLETWFTLPGHAVVIPPPNYKMAAIIFTALYPILIGVIPLLGLIASGEPFLAASVTVGPEFAVQTLVATLIVVPLMTWIAVPLMTMLAHRWLYPRS